MKRKTTPPLTGKEKERKELTLALIAEWKKSSERERGLKSHNTQRQRKAERNYQEYRDIAEMLIAGNPQLRGATYNRLAKEVRAELRRRGKGVVSARTIWEALRLKNKV